MGNRVKQYDLYRRVAKRLNIANCEAQQYVVAIFDEISKILKSGDSVTIKNFGRFEIYQTKSRNGTDPNTLKPIRVDSHRLARCKISPKLQKKVKAYE